MVQYTIYKYACMVQYTSIQSHREARWCIVGSVHTQYAGTPLGCWRASTSPFFSYTEGMCHPRVRHQVTYRYASKGDRGGLKHKRLLNGFHNSVSLNQRCAMAKSAPYSHTEATRCEWVSEWEIRKHASLSLNCRPHCFTPSNVKRCGDVCCYFTLESETRSGSQKWGILHSVLINVQRFAHRKSWTSAHRALNAQSRMLGELLASGIADNIAGNRFWWRHQHPPLGATTAAHCQIERGGEVAQQKKEFCGLVKLLTC